MSFGEYIAAGEIGAKLNWLKPENMLQIVLLQDIGANLIVTAFLRKALKRPSFVKTKTGVLLFGKMLENAYDAMTRVNDDARRRDRDAAADVLSQ
jgi:hypothetical protein